jgi:hypothetical protein
MSRFMYALQRSAREREIFMTPCLGGLLHELSNDGAKRQFESFLENDIFPVLVESAQVKISTIRCRSWHICLLDLAW